jgi:hypothetical protein
MRAFWCRSILAAATCAPALAQWLGYPTAGIPRTADGKPNLSAPAPKTADDKPDLSGIWLVDDRKYFFDLAADYKPGEEVPMQPWAKALIQQHVDR